MSVYQSVHPSVRMEQHGSYLEDFHEILYLRIFRKFVKKIQAWSKSEKINWHFT